MVKLLAALLRPFDRLLNVVMGAGFGLKDLFTIVNLLGGVASICFAMAGNLWWASFIIMLGYLGDVFDGPVARLMGNGNRFGTEFDTIADHTSQCIAPAFVVYLAYREISWSLAFGLAALLVVVGSIRHARGAAASYSFHLAWCGMPRPVSAFLTLSFINSQLFQVLPGGAWIGVGFIVLMAVLFLVPLPFTSHHGRKLPLYAKAWVAFVFVLCAAVAIWWTLYFWDVLFAVVVMYSLGSWIVLTPEERQEFFSAYHRWRAELSGKPAEAEER